ncbi:mitochondrial calcium uniporter regulator 1 [Synchiropus picturatus]
MVLKQCQPRLKVFLLNRPERFYDSAHNKDSFTLCARASNLPADSLTLTDVAGSGGGAPGARAMRSRAPRRIHVRELSTSTNHLQYDLKPEIPKAQGRQLYFDTHAVVRLLEDNGFTTQQAEVLVQVLMKMTHSNMDTIYRDMVNKAEQEIMLQRVMSQIAALKKDMIILEKSEFSTLLAENEKLKIQLLQLKVQLADVMNKLRADSILDMNLEKSRVNELKTEHEKRLLEMRTEIMEMIAEQDRHLTQSNMKIDTEVAGLKTMLESHKLDTIKYLAGSVFTCLTVVLGFYRIWM